MTARLVKFILRISELLGLMIGFSRILITSLLGLDLSTPFFEKAYSIFRIVKLLRVIPLFLGFIPLITILFWWKRKWIRDKAAHTAIKFVFKVLVGFFLAQWLQYMLLNVMFFRDAFMIYPFVIGSLLLVITTFNLILEEIHPLGIIRGIGLIKHTLLVTLALLLILPNYSAMLGLKASPPTQPETGIGGIQRPFDVEQVFIEHKIPDYLHDSIVPEPTMENDTWYTGIYYPDTSQQMLPVAIVVAGYSGVISDYESTMNTLSSRGMVAIYVQYATSVILNDTLLQEQADPEHDPRLLIRYEMFTSGLIQVLDYLNDHTEIIGDNTLDPSNLMVIGHSMGGGMVPYVTTLLIDRGFGASGLIMDMEASYLSLKWEGYEANLTNLPDHSLVNVVGYEDDHLVSQCIGFSQFERIRSRDNTTLLLDDQIEYLFIPSDRYGFPRLVATHYLPAEALKDALSIFAYYRRIDAEAAFLFGLANGELQSDEFFLGAAALNLGVWSDGTSVKPIIHSDDPWGLRNGPELRSILQFRDHSTCKKFD